MRDKQAPLGRPPELLILEPLAQADILQRRSSNFIFAGLHEYLAENFELLGEALGTDFLVVQVELHHFRSRPLAGVANIGG